MTLSNHPNIDRSGRAERDFVFRLPPVDYVTSRLAVIMRHSFGMRCPPHGGDHFDTPLSSFPGIIDADLVNLDIAIENGFGISFTCADFDHLAGASFNAYAALITDKLRATYSFDRLLSAAPHPVASANRDPNAEAPGGDGPLMAGRHSAAAQPSLVADADQ